MVILGKTLTKQNIPKIIGFSVISLLALGSLVYGGLIWNEKQQFNRAEKEMDALTAQIIEKVGKPDQQKKEKSCGYASQEFSRGPRSCWIGSYSLYTNIDANKANQILKGGGSIAKVVPKDRLARHDITDYLSAGVTPNNQEFGAAIKTSSSKDCVLGFTYPFSHHKDYGFTGTQTKDLLFSLHCSGPALAEYYPVTSK